MLKKKKTNEALQKIPYAFCARFLDGNKERKKKKVCRQHPMTDAKT
jgi:hypothetical protein